MKIKNTHYHFTTKDIELIRKNPERTVRELVKIVGKSQSSINRMAKKHGIKFPLRKYIPTKLINNDFFKTQSSEMAYILGFIAADGCLRDGGRGHDLRIKLAIKDEKHLIKIAEIMEFKGKMYYNDNKEYPNCLFAIGSIPIFNDLLTYNITPRKSLTLTWPDKLDERFIPDYIRGYFDGDGWIKIQPHHVDSDGKSAPRLEFAMVGTLKCMTEIKKYINKITKNEYGSITFLKRSLIYQLTFGGNISAEAFGKIIYYKESLLKLERKYKRFKKWFNIKGQKMTKIDYDNLKLDKNYKY